jgi:pyruvate/2-oxoglutarate dehydrogenase complex dihydrolipoamide acyltransferase (E2) component
MTEGTLAQWLVADGARVEKGRVRELLERPGVLLVQDQPSR